MRLSELNPEWVNQHDGSRGIGIELDCPCGKCGFRLVVLFEVALDGKPVPGNHAARWGRTGDTFETLTLSPSIQRVRLDRRTPESWAKHPLGSWPGDCAWHGYIEAGAIRHV